MEEQGMASAPHCQGIFHGKACGYILSGPNLVIPAKTWTHTVSDKYSCFAALA
jgi:hypothetical protein